MIHTQLLVDKLPIGLTVRQKFFESSFDFNDLSGVNSVDTSVPTKLARMVLGMEAITLDFLSLSVLDKARKSEGNWFVSDYPVD